MFVEDAEADGAAIVLDVQSDFVKPTLCRNFSVISAVLSKVYANLLGSGMSELPKPG